MKIKDLPTPLLISYSAIFENLINTGNQLVNEANDIAQRNAAGDPKKLERIVATLKPLVDPIVEDTASFNKNYVELQQELDSRFKKEFGLTVGIRKMQVNIEKFEASLEQIANAEIAERNSEMKKIITEDDMRPPLKVN